MALVVSSSTPLVLLDSTLVVKAVSGSFCRAFALDSHQVVGAGLLELGNGEWNIPQLGSLLRATASGHAAIDTYEMDLVREGHSTCRLVLNAHKLDYPDSDEVLVVLAVSDVSAARLAEKLRIDLEQDKHVLHQELQHRVANSLQIIASVIMQSARRVQSDEARMHLHDAHHRVMSIATLQKQLAVSSAGEVALRPYLTDLCSSIAASMVGNPERQRLTATVDDSVVSADVSASLGLIVTELVINALKHAFPGDDPSGTIKVDYSSSRPAWTLTVTDDGIGMPRGDAAAKGGLGTGIVDALSKHLNASVFITDANPGTMVSIVHS
ncbi:MAG: sensor histidine kinase [Verrucomicrobiaceae bacterium]|nr:MAG: sensor histidine kinase [Verrucomicrobiaceae bacterium]